LLQIVSIKALCRRANVDKVDVGPKGAVIGFRDNIFANAAGLIRWIAGQGSLARVRPDQKVVLMRDWADMGGRLKGTTAMMAELSRLATEGAQAAA
jgi:transcription-repair coupling factor (superfamily II helicase)